MEIKIKHIEHAHSEYGHVGYIALTNNTKIWFGGMQPIKDEEEARKVADLYIAAPLMLKALIRATDKILDMYKHTDYTISDDELKQMLEFKYYIQSLTT